MSVEDNFERLTHNQRLKAAVHHTTLKICQDYTEGKDVQLNRMVVAAISEATWKKLELFSTDLELFSKHGKRTTVTADDVKMLVRKSPKLLQHINNLHGQINVSKGEPKKRSRKSKAKDTAAATTSASVADIDMDEDSRS